MHHVFLWIRPHNRPYLAPMKMGGGGGGGRFGWVCTILLCNFVSERVGQVYTDPEFLNF
jgi:hypothetical protein